jgi:PST family polysaccharide transporter
MGVWGLTLGMYASSLVGMVVSWSLSRWRPRLELVSWGMWRELAVYARHVVASEFLREGGRVFNTALVGRFLGPAALGQYRFALRLATQTSDPVVAASGLVLLPAFARISRDEIRLRAAFLRALRFLATVTLPISLALFPLGEQLAVVLFGDRWRAAGQALMALCGVGAARSLTTLASEVFKATGRPELLAWMQLLALVLPTLFMVALLPFGLVGIGAGMSLGSLGVAVYAARALERVLPVTAREILRELVPPAFAALAMALSLYLVEHLALHAEGRRLPVAIGLLGVEGALGAALYVVFLAAIVPKRAREVADLITTARARRRSRRPSSLADVTPPTPPAHEADT